MSRKQVVKICLIVFLVAVFGIAWKLGIGQYLSLESIHLQQEALRNYKSLNPLLVLGGFFLAYIAVAGLSLPGATIMTLLGGALFGFWQGVIIISFASTIGATISFLLARCILKDWIQGRYQKQLSAINDGFEKEGAFYLFALRLIPVFPFFLVNILTSVMPIKTRNFYLASQLGMLPGTMVYIYAGTELGKIQSLSDIASPSLLVAFVILGLFPLITKKLVTTLRSRGKI